MSIARKVLLAALMALAAMAFAASTASAQEIPVEFETENGGNCNPCIVHIEGESHARDLISPGQPLVSKCHDELNARLYHGGTGEIERVGINHAVVGPGCTTVNCASPERHWPVSAAGERADATLHVTLRFCFSGFHCNGEVNLIETASHNYQLAMAQICFNGARRVEGNWATEGEPNFEIDHTPGT
jgi:hypothetical protein